jgi:uracil-DNA glycosylase
MPYLESQLEVIQPKLTVTLGRHSLNCFLPDLSISQVHGQPKRYKGRVYLPLFHTRRRRSITAPCASR